MRQISRREFLLLSARVMFLPVLPFQCTGRRKIQEECDVLSCCIVPPGILSLVFVRACLTLLSCGNCSLFGVLKGILSANVAMNLDRMLPVLARPTGRQTPRPSSGRFRFQRRAEQVGSSAYLKHDLVLRK